jgi:hypothetical protein
LRRGGCGIFREPVRNSTALTFVRSLIEFRAPDISLTDDALRRFAASFSAMRRRVLLGQRLPVVGTTQIDRLCRNDRALLRAIPALSYYAGTPRDRGHEVAEIRSQRGSAGCPSYAAAGPAWTPPRALRCDDLLQNG